MVKKKYKYAFARKKHSGMGIASSVLGGISLGLFCIASLCSLALQGNGGIFLGGMGFTAIGLSIYGFILGLKSFSEKNRDPLYCKIGAVGNGILMVIWLALFLLGIS